MSLMVYVSFFWVAHKCTCVHKCHSGNYLLSQSNHMLMVVIKSIATCSPTDCTSGHVIHTFACGCLDFSLFSAFCAFKNTRKLLPCPPVMHVAQLWMSHTLHLSGELLCDGLVPGLSHFPVRGKVVIFLFILMIMLIQCSGWKEPSVFLASREIKPSELLGRECVNVVS